MFSSWSSIDSDNETSSVAYNIPNEKIENLINSNCRKRRKPFFFSLLHNRLARNLRMKRLDYRLYEWGTSSAGVVPIVRVDNNILIIRRPAWIVRNDQRTAKSWAAKMAIMYSRFGRTVNLTYSIRNACCNRMVLSNHNVDRWNNSLGQTIYFIRHIWRYFQVHTNLILHVVPTHLQ